MNRNDLRGLASTRLREAKVLLKSGEFAGAYYLAGYAVECGLKECIARRTNLHDFPDNKRAVQSWSQDPERLVGVAELKDSLDTEIKSDPVFSRNWANVIRWNEASRYAINAEREAIDLIKAISDRKHVVLRWLKRYW
jgi:hypothetical protein